ncbi:glycoside hydrolase family 43 protein [Microbacterium invictum]|uniref:Glycoside hydrolase family 43 protein n=1 Tax=Microbacterium invictum TaxID=515415 RepID=A0ABZ0VBQ8_9MICO|nr:glycoside hydrolase family 43 protein [Microbacterium invictum]WQB69570.1 glycoside hydrolase family 43 protein [Microbacterium invictum]
MTRRRGVAGSALCFALVVMASGCAAAPTLEPVLREDFADPDVLEVDGGYVAYSSDGNRRNVPVATSDDLRSWELREDALPDLPSWIIPGKTWAPEVTEISPGRFVMYFTATNFRPTYQCIGVAVADDPLGPFTVQGEEMLICPPDEGGAIDASTIQVDGDWHLIWKNDGNAIGVDTWLQTAPLTPDGLGLAGEPARMIKQDQEWEGDLIEAPTVVAHDEGGFTMLYSANSYGGDEYAIGYAVADTLEGPWQKAEGPWISTESLDEKVRGPGGQDVVTGPDGDSWLLFHGWDSSYTYRMLHVAPLTWEARSPQLG